MESVKYMHKDYDNLLAVNTKNSGMTSEQSITYNQYEATPYSILHALFDAYKLERTDVFVDFGCGKGRLLFYVHNHFQASVTGIEMNEQLYNKTVQNKKRYLKRIKSNNESIKVKHFLAEDYKIGKQDNKFYFFNPFSVEVFSKVVDNILRSIESRQRETDIILYYPRQDYVRYLEENTPFECIKEVKIPGLFNLNKNERFLVFRYDGINN